MRSVMEAPAIGVPTASRGTAGDRPTGWPATATPAPRPVPPTSSNRRRGSRLVAEPGRAGKLYNIGTEPGHVPRVRYEQSLADTVSWHRNNHDWRASPKERATLT